VDRGRDSHAAASSYLGRSKDDMEDVVDSLAQKECRTLDVQALSIIERLPSK
jgi:hypothetical protein